VKLPSLRLGNTKRAHPWGNYQLQVDGFISIFRPVEIPLILGFAAVNVVVAGGLGHGGDTILLRLNGRSSLRRSRPAVGLPGAWPPDGACRRMVKHRRC
jgi:hypothetical protein